MTKKSRGREKVERKKEENEPLLEANHTKCRARCDKNFKTDKLQERVEKNSE